MDIQSEWIVDVTTENFESTVVEQSKRVPVVLDFWAPWCGPCRQLAPILEKLADQFQGQFLLAKINVDQASTLGGMFGVQSIPHVIALKNGEVVDQFIGLLPEEQLTEWIQSLLPTPQEELIQAGQALEPTDLQAAEEKFREALKIEAEHHQAKIYLAQNLLAQDRLQESQELIAELAKRGYLEPEAEKIKSQLDLKQAAQKSGGIEQVRTAAQSEPDNLSLQLDLADHLAVSGEYQEAMDICLTVVQQDKGEIGQQAKQTLLKIFDIPDNHPELISEYRRKLTSMLY